METNNKYKKCPYCGGEILSVARKCKHCGQWIDNNIELFPCPICKESIPKGVRVCPYCNEKIELSQKEIKKTKKMCPICMENIDVEENTCPYCKENITQWENELKRAHEENNKNKGETKDETLSNNNKYFWKRLSKGDKTVYSIACVLIVTILLAWVIPYSRPSSTTQISDKDAVSQVVEKWSRCHNSWQERQKLISTYASNVKYYQSMYSRDQVAASKDKLFSKYKVFQQEILNVHISFPAPDTAFVEFNKKVLTTPNSDAYDIYPSYLRLIKYGGTNEWRIIEESDYITDANLAKRKKSK